MRGRRVSPTKVRSDYRDADSFFFNQQVYDIESFLEDCKKFPAQEKAQIFKDRALVEKIIETGDLSVFKSLYNHLPPRERRSITHDQNLNTGKTYLHFALDKGKHKIIDFLLSKKATHIRIDKEGDNIASKAISINDYGTIILLLKHGLIIGSPNKNPLPVEGNKAAEIFAETDKVRRQLMSCFSFDAANGITYHEGVFFVSEVLKVLANDNGFTVALSDFFDATQSLSEYFSSQNIKSAISFLAKQNKEFADKALLVNRVSEIEGGIELLQKRSDPQSGIPEKYTKTPLRFLSYNNSVDLLKVFLNSDVNQDEYSNDKFDKLSRFAKEGAKKCQDSDVIERKQEVLELLESKKFALEGSFDGDRSRANVSFNNVARDFRFSSFSAIFSLRGKGRDLDDEVSII